MGRRLVKTLYHDPDVALVLGVDSDPSPSFLEAYRSKCVYQRLDLAKARHLLSFFQSERFARARLDSVIHLPFVHERVGERVPGNLHVLVSETRRLLEHCKRESRIERFVYLSTSFVYEPEPGNVSFASEAHSLDLEGNRSPEVRAWVDADLLCQAELHDPRLRMTILRSATIATESGEFLLSPPLEHGEPPIGFDPMVSVVSDRDVARALALALHSEQGGIYNIAGREVFPLSELVAVRASGGRLRLAFGVRSLVSRFAHTVSALRSGNQGYCRYGVVLDTRRATEALGFEPHYRIELRRVGNGKRVEAIRCR
jgi:nucleoside-diphosphate-sugar epimerase